MAPLVSEADVLPQQKQEDASFKQNKNNNSKRTKGRHDIPAHVQEQQLESLAKSLSLPLESVVSQYQQLIKQQQQTEEVHTDSENEGTYCSASYVKFLTLFFNKR